VEPSKLQAVVKPYVAKSNTQATANSNFSLGAALPKSTAQSLTLTNIGLEGKYTVLMNRLALRITPDINASILQNLSQGQVVQGLRLSSRGAWTAVDAGGERGWVATQWLQPVASNALN
jgi:pilus assembly protein CpaC